MSSLNLKKILERVRGGVEAHFCFTFKALSMAASTSLLFARLTSAIFSPWAGLNMSPSLSDLLKYSLPSINWLIFLILIIKIIHKI